MRNYPIFLDLEGRTVLVLGTGEAADRRAAVLAACGSQVRRAAVFAPELLDGCVLAVGTGAPEQALAALSASAQARGLPVNIVDRPELSSYLTPAIVDRDPLTIAIGTGGAAPVLARLVRARIEQVIAPGWGRLAAFLDRWKAETRRYLPEPGLRRRFLDTVLTGGVAELVLAERASDADAAYVAALERGQPAAGIVHLVGAGPGAADLLTLRGLRLLGEADVIVHDRLGTAAVLDLARRDAERIDVGKREGAHSLAQTDICALLVRLGREGRRVVRLKGGDPFLFGRGGEEVAALSAAGVAHEVVPGVTAALACAASAGVPLTHRDAAHAVTFVTAHRRDTGFDHDMASLLRPGITLAVYMGLATIGHFCDALAEAGISCDLPAIAVESGGTPEARVLRGTVGALAEIAPRWSRGGPVMLFLGGTAALPAP